MMDDSSAVPPSGPAEGADEDTISRFWSNSPETYSVDGHGGSQYRLADGSIITVEPGTREFFEMADEHQQAGNFALHDEHPFGRIFPFARYRDKNVLEVGCGQGGMAHLWAARGARMTAVDLNPDAVAKTQKRFELFGLNHEGNRIEQADARTLQFPDSTFDYAYSWGVLHHSPDLPRSLSEFFRVLKPGGEFGLMLYNRRSLLYAYWIAYREGFLHAESRHLTPLQLASRYTDDYPEEGNPHTWPVTTREARAMLSPYAADLEIRVLGLEFRTIFSEILPGVAKRVPVSVMKSWARRWGWSLWISGTRH